MSIAQLLMPREVDHIEYCRFCCCSIRGQTGASFWVVSQEALKRSEEFGSMFDSAVVESLVDVVDDDRPNGFGAVRLIKQIARQRCSRDFGHVLVLTDRGDFLRVQAAKVDAILQRNHCVFST
jgi:hypothetical protein